MAIKRPNANLLKCNFHIAVACCMFAACLRYLPVLFSLFLAFFLALISPIFRFVFHVAICQNARSTSAATTPRSTLPPLSCLAPLLALVRLHRARPSWRVVAVAVVVAAAAAWQYNQFLINCKIFFIALALLCVVWAMCFAFSHFPNAFYGFFFSAFIAWHVVLFNDSS